MSARNPTANDIPYMQDDEDSSGSAMSADLELYNTIANKTKTRPSQSKRRPSISEPLPPAPKPPRRNRHVEHKEPSASEDSYSSDDDSDSDASSVATRPRSFTFEPAKSTHPVDPRPKETRVAKEVRIEATLNALKLEVPDLDRLSVQELDALDEKLRAQSAREQALNLMRRAMIIFVAIVEHVHTYFNGDHKYLLEGWSMEVFNDLHAYDKHLLQIYDHYALSAPLHPLLGFMLALGGSAVMYAMTRSFMKFSIESMRGLTGPPTHHHTEQPPPPQPEDPPTNIDDEQQPPPPPPNPRRPPPSQLGALFGQQPAGPTGGHPLGGNPLFGAVNGLMNSGALGPMLDGIVGMMQQQQVPQRPTPAPMPRRERQAGNTNNLIGFQTTPSIAESRMPTINEITESDDKYDQTTPVQDLPITELKSQLVMSPPHSPIHDSGTRDIVQQLQEEEDNAIQPPLPQSRQRQEAPTRPGTQEDDVFQISLD